MGEADVRGHCWGDIVPPNSKLELGWENGQPRLCPGSRSEFLGSSILHIVTSRH
jgi:hypothetical protein